MKLILRTIIFLLAYPILSQGFNWQYSSRLPYKSPVLFGGVNASWAYSASNGNFPFVEDRFTCCEFELGSGYALKFGINAEYWFEPLQSINLKMNYYSLNSDFSKVREFPVILHGAESFMEQYQYDYSTSMNYVNLSAAYRYKFNHTQLSAIARANFSYLFSEDNSSIESRIGPADKVTTYTRTISEGRIKSLRDFYLAPEIALAYDINAGKGQYFTLELFTEIPIFSMTEDSEWYLWQFGLNIAIYRGLIF